MLRSLTIENFAIIDQVTLDLEKGMTVLSGETGAGKSIIIDALGLLVGGRGSNDLIRLEADKLVVEGLFSFDVRNPQLEAILENFGIEFGSLEEDLIIRRELNRQGKNTVRVNGQLANVSLLKQLGYLLVDIHGQSEHQALLDKHFHLDLLDQFGQAQLGTTYAAYREAYQHYHQIRNQWLEGRQDERDQHQRLNFLTFQLEELEAAQVVKGEMAQLAAQSQRLQNHQRIQRTLSNINELLSESDRSVLSQLSQVRSQVEEISRFDDRYPALLTELSDVYYQLDELAHQLALSDQGQEDLQDIDIIEARLSQLEQLTRKYGLDEAGLLDYYQEISEEIYQLTHREQYLAQLQEGLLTAYHSCVTLAQEVQAERQRVATALVEAIEGELTDLYMAQARFQVVFDAERLDSQIQELIEGGLELSPHGLGGLEFYAATNPGEGMKPLVKVASGGELSRFMLALKSVFSRGMDQMVLVFDEIDTGVSGRVAQAIAEKMHELAHYHQLLCITHLAQVAAKADQHLYIEKDLVQGRTLTQVTPLTETDRTEAIASMLSGEVLTPASIQMAQELRQQGKRKDAHKEDSGRHD